MNIRDHFDIIHEPHGVEYKYKECPAYFIHFFRWYTQPTASFMPNKAIPRKHWVVYQANWGFEGRQPWTVSNRKCKDLLDTWQEALEFIEKELAIESIVL